MTLPRKTLRNGTLDAYVLLLEQVALQPLRTLDQILEHSSTSLGGGSLTRYLVPRDAEISLIGSVSSQVTSFFSFLVSVTVGYHVVSVAGGIIKVAECFCTPQRFWEQNLAFGNHSSGRVTRERKMPFLSCYSYDMLLCCRLPLW